MFTRTKLYTYYRSYCQLRTQFGSYQKLLYQDYLSRIESNIRHNPKSFFDYVNLKRKTTGYPSVMSLGSTTSSSPAYTSELFAEFFKSVYTSSAVQNNRQPRPTATHTNNLNHLSLSTQEILASLSKLKTNSLNSPDGVPAIVLKHCAESLLEPLSAIFNNSLQSASFPDAWKVSSITPIHKAGPRRSIENYRGIAILSSMGKLFESLVYTKIADTVFDRLTPLQHGFVKKRSIATNLLHFTDYAIKTIESGCQLDVLYVDFSKAFDRIPHDILCQKLDSFNLPPLFTEWIESYLTGRTQYQCC